MNDHASRLSALRKRMKSMRVDGVIIPQGDAWQSEHGEACDDLFGYICGLDASAGYVVVTQDEAVVLIDGRYTLTAKEQVDMSLFSIDYYTSIKPEEWAILHLKPGQVLGYDSWLHTKAEAKRMQKACNAAGLILQSTDTNPVGDIWNDRPAPMEQTAISMPLDFAGQSVDEKIKTVCQVIESQCQADSAIISAPDSIAWMLNLRTVEDPRAPGIKGFAIVECASPRVTVFTDVDCAAFDHSQCELFEVDFLPLEELQMAIHHFENVEQTVFVSDQAPDWFTDHLNAPASEVLTGPDPVALLKACKNEVEQDGIRQAHKRDARAMMAVMQWIKTTQHLTEQQVADRLNEERSIQNLFRGISFYPIVGWNANGAKIHGNPTDTVIEGNGFLLIDSGGQYDDGTTDITRTLAIGHPTDEMKEKYTLVLKGHIALASAIFPAGTTGAQLDALARKPLWDAGLDYAHGTGHGVGHFLNVHEGPAGISPRVNEPLHVGMLLSNEPGYYREGAFGIRLENLMLVQKYKGKDEPRNETGRDLLCFETVSFVPFEADCIIEDMLSDKEKAWLYAYNQACQI